MFDIYFNNFIRIFILKISIVTVKTPKLYKFPSTCTSSQLLPYKLRTVEIGNFTLNVSMKNAIERLRGETFRQGIS